MLSNYLFYIVKKYTSKEDVGFDRPVFKVKNLASKEIRVVYIGFPGKMTLPDGEEKEDFLLGSGFLGVYING